MTIQNYKKAYLIQKLPLLHIEGTRGSGTEWSACENHVTAIYIGQILDFYPARH